MAEREITKKYTNGELTVIWKPHLCIHSRNCVKALPQVYNPAERPWIKAEKATIAELKNQIALCPSGALSHSMDSEAQTEPEATETKIDVQKNGPLLIYGHLAIAYNGHTDSKQSVTALCRCGASGNKPYCDGSHRTITFEG